jgi:hypothetical protein
MIVAIHQPNYLPWCGYFAKIAAADVFVVLDDVPLSNGRSFVSRTEIASPHGKQWLTVPVARTRDAPIAEARFADQRWPARHVRTLQAMYGHASYAPTLLTGLQALYASPGERLAEFNLALLRHLLHILGIGTPVVRASQLQVGGTGSQHLLGLVQAVGGTAYLSGPSGQRYLDPGPFADARVAIRYGQYEPQPYPRGRLAFVPALSILDALFHIGSAQTRALLSYRLRP